MTPFRARIREIAEDVAVGEVTATNVEFAILRAIEELLTQEPSEAAMERAYACSGISIKAMWREMAAQRLKEVKGE